MASRRKPIKWKDSKAKALLELDIIAGVVFDTDDPKEVFAMRSEYEPYKENFKTNLSNLLKKVNGQKTKAEFDEDAVYHDRSLNPLPARNGHGRRQWKDSEAQKLVRKAILEDKTFVPGQDKPETFWKSNPEFLKFELEPFRNHLYKEVKSEKSRCYFKDKARKWTFNEDDDDEEGGAFGYARMTVAELKVELRYRGLKVSGKRADLIGRIQADDDDDEESNE